MIRSLLTIATLSLSFGSIAEARFCSGEVRLDQAAAITPCKQGEGCFEINGEPAHFAKVKAETKGYQIIGKTAEATDARVLVRGQIGGRDHFAVYQIHDDHADLVAYDPKGREEPVAESARRSIELAVHNVELSHYLLAPDDENAAAVALEIARALESVDPVPPTELYGDIEHLYRHELTSPVITAKIAGLMETVQICRTNSTVGAHGVLKLALAIPSPFKPTPTVQECQARVVKRTNHVLTKLGQFVAAALKSTAQ